MLTAAGGNGKHLADRRLSGSRGKLNNIELDDDPIDTLILIAATCQDLSK